MTEISSRVRSSLQAGRMIEAVKYLREEQGLGLRDAKVAIDEHVASNPGAYPALERGAPVNGAHLLLGFAIALAAALVIFFSL